MLGFAHGETFVAPFARGGAHTHTGRAVAGGTKAGTIIYSAIYAFLGVGVSNAPNLDVQDKFTSHYEPMRNATMERLKKHFKEENERLFHFLGRRVEAWE
jgi:hypothetical protein